jgi:prolyl oligopeptidase
LIKVKDEVYLYSFAGERLTRLAPDFVGAASVAGRRGKSDFFVTMTGFTTPGVVGRFDFTQKDKDKRWSIYRTTFVNGLDPEDFVAEQVRVFVSAMLA